MTIQINRRTALVATMATLSMQARAQAEWPSRSIVLSVGFAPGGPNDLVARQLALRLSEQLKQNVVVENKPGANGNIAAALVSRAPADGHLFLYNSSSLALSPALYPKKVVEPLAELTPVNGTASFPLVCVVAADFPADNFRDWAARVKANPGAYNYGSPGPGNLAHVVPAMLLKAHGLSAVHAPYKGSSEALQGLISGATHFQFDSINSPMALIKGGRVKPLFVTSAQRSPALPNVPTLAESGGGKFDMGAWQGVMAPMGTPDHIVARMGEEIAKAMNHPELKKALEAQGAYVISSTPQRYGALVAEQVALYKKAVTEAGIKLES
jgi:tripartite-type tricarboxylate transporter receptor subunit TctC